MIAVVSQNTGDVFIAAAAHKVFSTRLWFEKRDDSK